MTATLAVAVARRHARDAILQTAARGAVLVGAAVVVGILLLQVIDDSGGGGRVGGGPPPTGSNSSTTTTTSSNGRPPGDVAVQVLNASGVSGAAQTKANELRGLGYAIVPVNNLPVRAGTAVQCKTDFEKEAAALARTVGTEVIETFPNPVPEGVDAQNADCLVVLGT